MGGTAEGGKLAAQTNKEKYGGDFYSVIGSLGGKNGHTGGFAANPELARRVGKVGGARSKRTSADPFKRSRTLCTYCGMTGHRGIRCELRDKHIAQREALIVKQKEDRLRMHKLAIREDNVS